MHAPQLWADVTIGCRRLPHPWLFDLPKDVAVLNIFSQRSRAVPMCITMDYKLRRGKKDTKADGIGDVDAKEQESESQREEATNPQVEIDARPSITNGKRIEINTRQLRALFEVITVQRCRVKEFHLAMPPEIMNRVLRLFHVGRCKYD